MLNHVQTEFIKHIKNRTVEETIVTTQHGNIPTLKSIPNLPQPAPEINSLCVFVSGFGLDHTDFFNALVQLGTPESVFLAITPPAFYPEENSKYENNIDGQAAAILNCIGCELLQRKYENINIFGFSVGADMVASIIPQLNESQHLRNIYLADLNISKDSCFITSKISASPTENDALAAIALKSNNDELADIANYFAKILRKNRWDEFQVLAGDVVKHVEDRFDTLTDFMKQPRGFNLHLGFSNVEEQKQAQKAFNVGKIYFDATVPSHFDFLEIARLEEITKRFGWR